jgi:hypothetical protein
LGHATSRNFGFGPRLALVGFAILSSFPGEDSKEEDCYQYITGSLPRFDSFNILEGVEGAMRCKFMAVVIDTATQRVCTAYPTDKPKPGSKEYKPEGDVK